MFFQDIGQLRELYDNTDSFLNNCDKQFFGVTGFETAKLVSDMSGTYLERWTEGAENAPRYQERERNLRNPADIQEELRKGSGLQYVFPANTPTPLRLKLVPFDRRNRKLPPYDGQAAHDSVAEQKRRQHEEASRSGLIQYWKGNLKDPETRQEAIEELRKLGVPVRVVYSKSADDAAREQSQLDEFLKTVEAMNNAPMTEEEKAEYAELNDQNIRNVWPEFDPQSDYAGYYDRNGDSLSREELEQLSALIAQQEQASSKSQSEE